MRCCASCAGTASRASGAHTPNQALQLARRFYDDNLIELDFRSYDDNAGLDQIQIWDSERGTLASWESDDYRLRKAALEVLTALQAQTVAVVDSWHQGDLAAAVCTFDASISAADAAIAIASAAPRRAARALIADGFTEKG